MIPHVKAGRIRGIAVTTVNRSNATPEIPTVAETLPGYEARAWAAVLGPKALPKDIAARWQMEIDRILRSSDAQERMARNGMEPAGASRASFRQVLERDVAKWQKVVQIAGIKPGS